MSLSEHKPYFKQLIWKGSLLLILIVLGLSYHHLIPESIELAQNESQSLNSQIGPIAGTPDDDLHDFQIAIQSDNTAGLQLNNRLNIQVILTIARPVEGLHLNWSLQQDVQIVADSSHLPSESLSIREQEDNIKKQEGLVFCEDFPCTLEYNLTFQITGRQPHLVLRAYTLGASGERLGTIAEFSLVRDSHNYFVPPSHLPSKAQFDPHKIKIVR